MLKEYLALFRRFKFLRIAVFFFEAHLFDLIYKTDTASYMTQHKSDSYNFGYQGSYTSTVKKSIIKAKEIFKDFRLLDLGSGKGKVIILASLMGVKKVIGIEVDEGLSEIANRNLDIVGISELVEITNIDVKNLNVGNYPGVNVIFMYNPFSEQVIREFLSNNNQFIIGIIYVNPVYDHVILDYDYVLFAEISGRYPIQNVKIFVLNENQIT